MLKSFDHSDREEAKASGRQPEQRSKATGGGKSPLDPMGSAVPGYSAAAAQRTGDSPGEAGSDYTSLANSTTGDKKSPGLPGR